MIGYSLAINLAVSAGIMSYLRHKKLTRWLLAICAPLLVVAWSSRPLINWLDGAGLFGAVSYPLFAFYLVIYVGLNFLPTILAWKYNANSKPIVLLLNCLSFIPLVWIVALATVADDVDPSPKDKRKKTAA